MLSMYDQLLREYLGRSAEIYITQATTKKAARALIGGLSKPSKMPGYAFSIPARRCITGSKLHKIPGSVCASCYALKGRYGFPGTIAAQERRYSRLPASWRPVTIGDESQALDPAVWIAAMAEAIPDNHDHFRVHDAGDIQSVAHILGWIAVATLRPDVKFWIPTRERSIVAQCLRGLWRYSMPENLCVRISAARVGSAASGTAQGLGLPTSSVDAPGGFECLAYQRGGECGACRACWNPGVSNVNYPKH